VCFLFSFIISDHACSVVAILKNISHVIKAAISRANNIFMKKVFFCAKKIFEDENVSSVLGDKNQNSKHKTVFHQ